MGDLVMCDFILTMFGNDRNNVHRVGSERKKEKRHYKRPEEEKVEVSRY